MFNLIRTNTFTKWVKICVFIDSLGTVYGEACILDLDVTWSESETTTPLICILSIGSDPSPQITALAKTKEIGNIFH